MLAIDYGNYPPLYDELLSEVGTRLKKRGFATKVDLGALVFWKHINNSPWMTRLMNVSDQRVRAVTGDALAPQPTDSARLDALAVLPGFRGVRMASTFFAAWDPSTFAVQDRRALARLKMLVSDHCQCDREILPTYWEHIREIAKELSTMSIVTSWTPRNVDMALFEGGPVVNAVIPTVGPTKGGTNITISGRNLTGATQVSFSRTRVGLKAATTYRVDSNTQISATAPPFNRPGGVHVTVTTPIDKSEKSPRDCYTYV
jgi:hypothetical protein